VASSGSSRKSGLVASTKRAIMLASIGSVFAQRLGEVAHLRRIDHHDRQRSARQRGRHDGLEAARRFDRDPLRAQPPHALDEFREAFAVTRDSKGTPSGRT
jgi:hypothetical protein